MANIKSAKKRVLVAERNAMRKCKNDASLTTTIPLDTEWDMRMLWTAESIQYALCFRWEIMMKLTRKSNTLYQEVSLEKNK